MRNFKLDRPIDGSDFAPDKLNRTEFANKLSKSILGIKEESSFVVSIEGDWGSGKTSLFNLIKNEIRDKNTEDAIIVDYNPWLISNAENQVESFLIQLASTIKYHGKDKKAGDVVNQLLYYTYCITYSTSQLSNVLRYVPYCESVAKPVSKITNYITDKITNKFYVENLNIEERKDKVVESMKSLNKQLFIFIDDMDRLPPEELYQMIRCIKAVSDFPYTTFILAFERSYIEKALKYNKIKQADKYLDKIIQVRLNVPAINKSDVEQLALEELNNLSNQEITNYFNRDDQRLSEIFYFCIKPLMKTPREIKDVFNRLKFTEKSVRGEVAFSDLLGLETLAIKAPTLYTHIKNNPAAYIGKYLNSDYQIEDPSDVISKYESERLQYLNKTNTSEIEHITELIHYLFPLTKGSSIGSKSQESLSYHGRIASSDRFMIALSSGLPKYEVSTYYVKKFIHNDSERNSTFKLYFEEQYLDRFLEILIQNIAYHVPYNIIDFINYIGLIADSEIAKNSKIYRHASSANIARKCHMLTKKILNNLDYKSCASTIEYLINNTRYLTLSTYILADCLRQHNIIGEQKNNNEYTIWLEHNYVDELKNNWLNLVKSLFDSNTILNFNDRAVIFYIFQKLAPNDFNMLFKSLLNDVLNLDYIIDAFISHGHDTNGKFVFVDNNRLKSINCTDKLMAAVHERMSMTIPDNFLYASFLSLINNKSYYINDLSLKEEL